jgi:hypothetical protein
MDLKAELKILRPDEKAKLNKMEVVVDAELTKQSITGTKIFKIRRSFLAASIGGFTRKLLNLLMAKYVEGGYKVHEAGDFIVFSC